MIAHELTGTVPAARTRRKVREGKTMQQGMARSGRRAVRAAILKLGLILGAFPALSGCMNVSAPDKPIVIELNINIRQEVIYRLAADAANTIEENPEIF